MTIDDIIALAKDVERIHGTYGPPGCQAWQLGAAVLALLTPDKPCGWEAEFVARVTAPNYEGYRFVEIEHIEAAWPDEARWCAIQILRTAEKAEVTRG